jgi:hypothetical protein
MQPQHKAKFICHEEEILNWLLFPDGACVFDWHADCRGSENGYQQKNMLMKEIGLHTQNMITILGSIVNIIGMHI